VAAFLLLSFHGYSLLLQLLGEGGVTSIIAPILFGIASAALLSLSVLLIFLYRIKALPYEIWRVVHIVMYAMFGLGVYHALQTGTIINSFLPMKALVFFLSGLVLLSFLRRAMTLLGRFSSPRKLLALNQLTDQIIQLEVEKKADLWRGGQFMFLALRDRHRYWGAHPFSITMPPTATSLVFTIRQVGDFTKGLSQLSPQTKIYLEGPYGCFNLPVRPEPALVFVAGGIGITPIISMLRELRAASWATPAALLWSVREEADLVYRDELNAMSKETAAFHWEAVITGEMKGDSPKMPITAPMVRELFPKETNPLIYLCGPWPLVKNMFQGLLETGIKKERMRYERFSFL
jgi:predicted ferric reductase